MVLAKFNHKGILSVAMTASNSIHILLIFIVITLVQVVACYVLKVQVIFALYIHTCCLSDVQVNA